MNEVLSICIPTFNREKYLKQCLEYVVPQAKKYDVPIYISDNNSNDGTSLLVNNMKLFYDNIFYEKQSFNIGIDKNMMNVIKMSKTKYSWWLGDDDIIENDAISEVLKILNSNNEKSFVLLNGGFISEDLSKKFRQTTFKKNKDEVITKCVDFFKKNCFNMPFGTLIINNHILNNVNYERFIGTSHAYSGTVLEYLADEYLEANANNIYLVARPLVFLRCGEKSWKDESARILLLEIPQWFNLLHNIYKNDSRIILRKYLCEQNSFKNLVKYRFSNQLTINNYKELSNHFSFCRKLKVLLVVSIPQKIIDLLYKIYSKRLKHAK